MQAGLPGGSPADSRTADIQRWRQVCYRCHKPKLTCICDRIRRVHNRTKVWVIQHPRERFHPIGTARIAHLGLENVRVEVCYDRTAGAPGDLPTDAALIYPGDGVRDLTDLGEDELPSTLLVIDGTWAHAHTIYRDSPWLQHLPRYGLRPREAGRYRLRKEPARDCVSTIEAVVQALAFLEPDTPGLQDLIGTFDHMIDDQLELIARHRTGHRTHLTPRNAPGIPRVLTADLERLVAVYGEASRDPGDRRCGRRSLVQWAAVRPSTGETFEKFVVPDSGPGPTQRHLEHMGLSDAHMTNAVTMSELSADWTRFSNDHDVVVAWNGSTLGLLESAVAGPRRSLSLKSVYCARRRGPCGSIDDVLAREGLTAQPTDIAGRAGRRMGNLLALLTHLQSAHPVRKRPTWQTSDQGGTPSHHD